MKIVMRTNSSSAKGVKLLGKVYDVPQAEADQLIKGNFARVASANDQKAAAKKTIDEE